jgi:hypothetical protein
VVDRADRRAPLQGFSKPRSAWTVVAAVLATLSGSPCLSELHSVRRSGTIGSPHPPRRVDRPRGLPSSVLPRTRRSEAAPAGLGPSQGSLPRSGPRPHGRGLPSWGSAPLRRHGLAGPFLPGVASPGTCRPRGFSPPRRFPPRSLCGLKGRCRPWGSCAHPRPIRSPGCGALPHPSRSIAAGIFAPPALRV